ncbi:hypothetical protein AB0D46_18160 [Streptomyces sp. NPDC048383]|uniref:hypothetical protein n=1 Tax=Streptomyces sp. NPDC048383 TaxID=3155386 RepID=UPI00342D1290
MVGAAPVGACTDGDRPEGASGDLSCPAESFDNGIGAGGTGARDPETCPDAPCGDPSSRDSGPGAEGACDGTGGAGAHPDHPVGETGAGCGGIGAEGAGDPEAGAGGPSSDRSPGSGTTPEVPGVDEDRGTGPWVAEAGDTEGGAAGSGGTSGTGGADNGPDGGCGGDPPPRAGASGGSGSRGGTPPAGDTEPSPREGAAPRPAVAGGSVVGVGGRGGGGVGGGSVTRWDAESNRWSRVSPGSGSGSVSGSS